MVKTHEINLNIMTFNDFEHNNYIIVDSTNITININDYILFHQVDDNLEDTGLYRLTQVNDIIEDQGLKDGYILLMVNKF